MLQFSWRQKLSRKQERGKINLMKNFLLKLKVMKDTRAQDLIEYALMAGFVAVAAGAIMPGVATSISQIFSKVASVMTAAASQGS
jgi:Flp pilus assembly pilin Flp